MPAGAHVIELVDHNGATALATPPLDMRAGRLHTLVVFGNRDALQHRLVTTDLDVPTGMDRHTFVNLFRTGYALEVVRCDGDTPDTCTTTLAGPLAYRESTQIDFPRQMTEACNESIGPGITCTAGPWPSWRAVPTGQAGATPVVWSSTRWMGGPDPVVRSRTPPTGSPQVQFVARSSSILGPDAARREPVFHRRCVFDLW